MRKREQECMGTVKYSATESIYVYDEVTCIRDSGEAHQQHEVEIQALAIRRRRNDKFSTHAMK